LPPPLPNGAFGESVASAGDVNGDGFGDLVVGAPLTANFAGAVYVYLGGESGLQPTPITLTNPDRQTLQFGYTVAGAGDVNGDGYGDVVVAASVPSEAQGAAYLYLGGAAGLATTATT